LLGAPPARPRRRHWLIALSFFLAVVMHSLMATTYLTWTAADRYGSRVAFSIRSNQAAAPLEILGAVTQLGNSSVLTDGQLLYDFIQSQQIVETVRTQLPLEAYYNRAPRDWVFSLGEDPPVEDLIDYWNRMVDVSLDPVTGIITIEARAFTPTEAQAIAAAILAASADLVNRLADTAREDAVRYASVELAGAEQRLRSIRVRLRKFRDIEQEVDPSQNARIAIGLVAGLEEELSQARVQLELLSGALDDTAPRIVFLRRQIKSLQARGRRVRGTGGRPRIRRAVLYRGAGHLPAGPGRGAPAPPLSCRSYRANTVGGTAIPGPALADCRHLPAGVGRMDHSGAGRLQHPRPAVRGFHLFGPAGTTNRDHRWDSPKNSQIPVDG
jgi:capsular polysaccharide transport system permease protein